MSAKSAPWSMSSEAFVLFQLKQTTNFWRMRKPASFLLEVRPDGGADLNTKFQLGSPSEFLPPPNTPIHRHSYQFKNPASQVSSQPGPQSHPAGTAYRRPVYSVSQPRQSLFQPKSQISQKPDGLASTQRHRPPSYQRRSYRRAADHRARQAVAPSMSAPTLSSPPGGRGVPLQWQPQREWRFFVLMKVMPAVGPLLYLAKKCRYTPLTPQSLSVTLMRRGFHIYSVNTGSQDSIRWRRIRM